MSNNKIVDADKIQIAAIKTIKGNIDGSTDIDIDTIGGHHFQFELGTGINPEENVIGLQLLVDITAHDKELKPLSLTGSYTHEIIFVIENLSEFLTKDETSPTGYLINGVLGSTLVSIAYSTVRGIIFTRTQGTSLGSVVLPVIDPKKLMGL